jgi:monovalent cation:H+ antiporter-2, CPA2 family
VLLMFSIGVEFSIPDLMRVKSVALIDGPIGMLLVIGIALAAGKVAGWSTTEALVIGASVSVASTMVLARWLTDSGRLTTTHGRVMIGITLVEDLAVICVTVIVPVFGNSKEGGLVLAIWALGKALLLLIPLIFLAVKVILRFLRWVKRTCNSELLLLVAIAICLGTAARWRNLWASPSLWAHFWLESPSAACLISTTHTRNFSRCGTRSWRSFLFPWER